MDNSIYIMTTREKALFREMEVLANNLVNANTTGYNAERTVFEAYLQKDNNLGDKNQMAFAVDKGSYRDTREGAIKATGNPLDVAINGAGYFQVDTPLGTRYTRAGNFQLDTNGTLVTSEHHPVLDSNNQQIQFAEDAKEISIGENGIIKVNGEEFATIGVVEFASEQSLERVGGTLLKSEATPQTAQNFRVAQGALEGSNVQPVIELSRMIEINRSTASTAKFIEVMYDLQRKASSTYAQQS